jgi:predicted phosphodiesterase
MMDDWQTYVREHYVRGRYGYERLAKETGVPRISIRNFIGSGMIQSQNTKVEHGKTPKQTNEKILLLLKNGTDIKRLAKELKQSERITIAYLEDLKDQGYCIDIFQDLVRLKTQLYDDTPSVVEQSWKGNKIIRFGLLGDTHFGSKFVQIEHLNRAYEMFKSEGITDVYHSGDLTEGENMRQGHAYECYVHGADEHIDELVKNYPRLSGINTHYILGNHDASFVKHAGLNISSPISAQRQDMKYIGFAQATVKLTPNCIMELRHPGGGSAYAISYKAQKIVEALSGGTKPNIIAFGHYHKLEYLFYRNVHVLQTGTLQAQSNFMRDLGLAAHTGYWIITVHVNEEGHVTRILPEMIPIYQTIPDDWKNFR